MQAPIIGITTYARDEGNLFKLPATYADAVRQAGGIPVLLPVGETKFPPLLSALAGLILSGGGDVDPKRYHGVDHDTVYGVDRQRDEMEIALVKVAIEADVPLLAICRGMQILNVALGGTLHVHLPEVVGETVLHRRAPREFGPHPVAIAPQSRLHDLMGQLEISPMSSHHQALREVAPSLKVAAHAPDGIIEAVELPSHSWLYGVQWHPEITASEDPSQHRLFAGLVHAAATRAARS